MILLYCTVSNCRGRPIYNLNATRGSGHLCWVNLISSLVISANLPDVVSSQPFTESVCLSARPPASPSSLQPCRLCLKSFNPIRLCKYFFTWCLPRTSQIENSCPESVLLSSSKNKRQPERRANPLKIQLHHIKVLNVTWHTKWNTHS